MIEPDREERERKEKKKGKFNRNRRDEGIQNGYRRANRLVVIPFFYPRLSS